MFKLKIKNYLRSIFKKEFNLDPIKQLKKHDYSDEEKKVQKKKYNIKILTSFDESYKLIGDQTYKTHSKYASIYGYFFEKVKMPETGRSYAWNKIKILIDQMEKEEEKFEYLMWIDSDAFFYNFNKDISKEIDDFHEIYLVKHYCEIHKGSIYQNTKLTILRINSGVMLLKVSDHNLNFLRNIWNKTNYINHPWWEQAAMMDLIGLKSELNGNLNDNIGNNYLKKIKFLPNEWNSIPSNLDLSMEKHDPIIIHLAGMKNDARNNYIKKFIKN